MSYFVMSKTTCRLKTKSRLMLHIIYPMVHRCRSRSTKFPETYSPTCRRRQLASKTHRLEKYPKFWIRYFEVPSVKRVETLISKNPFSFRVISEKLKLLFTGTIVLILLWIRNSLFHSFNVTNYCRRRRRKRKIGTCITFLDS